MANRPKISKPAVKDGTRNRPGRTPGGKRPGGPKAGGPDDFDRKKDDTGAELTTQAPLLLLPMRLEYRFFEPGKTVQLLGHKNGQQVRRDYTAPSQTGAFWVRWYPDANFALRGIPAAAPHEIQALKTLISDPQMRDFPKQQDDRAVTLWQKFVADIGSEARAVHLWRHRADIEAEATRTPDEDVGRIAGLPQKVALFAVDHKQATLVAWGRDILRKPDDEKTRPVSFSPALLEGPNWMTDFDMAEAQGMGVRVDDREAVEQLKSADWVVAVGLSQENGVEEVERLMEDAIAGGHFAFLDSDAATNNAGETQTDHSTSVTAPSRGDNNRFDHELGQDQDGDGAAACLARSLGISGALLGKGQNAAALHRAASAAMMRAIGPVLLDDKLDGSTVLDGLDETDFIDAIVDGFFARGPHAPLRFGDGAYGILPVTPLDALNTTEMATPEKNTAAMFARLYGLGLGAILSSEAQRTTPVMEPADPDAAEKLELLLQSYPSGRRVEVFQDNADEPEPLGCAYVAGGKADFQPKQYLAALMEKALQDLEDPLGSDRDWPLLYRLIRRSMARNLDFEILRPGIIGAGRGRLGQMDGVQVNALNANLRQAFDWTRVRSLRQMSQGTTGRWPGVTAPVRRRLGRASNAFSEALRILTLIAHKDDGVARLETLMMETIDFFQYRLDAWVTGVAQMKLDHQRALENGGKAKPTGPLGIGHFGILGKPRLASTSAVTDGYLQAPTPAQATATAVLRSAQLRHRDSGAFDIDLSSRRVRLGLDLLDHLRHGIDLGEALGLLGERQLRRRQQSVHILPLRQSYPLSHANPEGRAETAPINRRGFDGLALVEDRRPGETALGELHESLTQAMDAIGDLVMAEAVYQRAMGSAERAAAWLDVLSGGSIPDKPAFIRSQRTGQASDHRVSLLLDPTTTMGSAKSNRFLERASPSVADFAAQLLPDLAQRHVLFRLTQVPGGGVVHEQRLDIEKTLKLSAMEMLFETPRTLERRAIATVLRRIDQGRNQRLKDAMARYDAEGLARSPKFVVEILMDSGETLADLQAPFAQVLSGLRRSRAMEPGDFQPFNSTRGEIAQDEALLAWAPAATEMNARARTLLAWVKLQRKNLSKLRFSCFNDYRETYLLGPNATVPSSDRQQILHCTKLDSILFDIFGVIPGGANPNVTFTRLKVDPVALEEAVMAVEATLDAQIAAAVALFEDGAASVETLGAAKATLGRAERTLRALLGRDKFPLLPRFDHVPNSRPSYGASVGFDDGLDEWPRLRARLAPVTALAGAPGGWSMREGTDWAEVSAKEGNADDPRGEDEAPLKHHFARVVGQPDVLDIATSFCGVVIDEWVETRPTQIQPATLAVNYDAPMAEAANAMLLCVPASFDAPAWTPLSAAGIVGEVIRWMTVRACSTQDTLLDTTILPGSNIVAEARRQNAWHPRIPVGQTKMATRSAGSIRGLYASGGAGIDFVGLAQSGLNEIGGFSGKRGGR